MKFVKRLIAGTSFVVLFGAAVSFAAGDSIKMEQMMMAKMMKYGSPGPHHKVLDGMVGKWTYTVQYMMTPTSKPQEMTGTSEDKWILGNRFVYEEATGGNPQMPFQGIGLFGYDNVMREYTSIWLDNMSTGIMEGRSQYDPKTKTFSEKGKFSCPMSPNARMRYRAVIKIVDNDHVTYKMYMRDPKSGKAFKSMEIDYTRIQS